MKKVTTAYFSMEIGLRNDLPTYAGGLGILAGDTLKAAADMEVPLVAVSLLYNQGYFSQTIEEGKGQVEEPVSWKPTDLLELLPEKVELSMEGRKVIVQAWLYRLAGVSGYELPVIFLDTKHADNSALDQKICDQLYGGDNYTRILQEIVLGIGGAKMLEKLAYTELNTYHMNEGHAAFLTLELLARYNWKNEEVRKRCVFTTHTPVPAGHDEFLYDLAYKVMGHYLPWHIKEIAGKEKLNMTILALNMSRFVNGVSKKHAEVSGNMFPDFNVEAITNGVHSVTWTAPQFQSLFDRYLPEWRKNPEILIQAVEVIPDQEFWQAHQKAKVELFDYIKKYTGDQFDPAVLTLGFARRAATYKRGDFVFYDLERLVKIGQGKIQLVFAGKSHPKDLPGKEIIRKIIQTAKKLNVENKIKVVFLPNYDMELARTIVAGVDVWLNTPIRPREASGTSGMKAVHNGVPNFSVLDGWWVEGWKENITGWAIGPEATECELIENNNLEDVNDFYRKLDEVVIPLYYNQRNKWLQIMKQAVAQNASYFNTHRMVREYLQKAYQAQKVEVR